MYENFTFKINKQLGQARQGEIHTPHGIINTPAFIFCGTRATLKGLFPSQFQKSQALLSNTYHLYLQPGADVVAAMGGLHKFCGWNGPMITDSGGYQIFSLGYGSVSYEIKGKRNNKRSIINIDESGAVFKSYLDGSIKHLTPEISIDIQRKLGADIILVLDECTPYNVTKEYTLSSMERSHRWASRSLEEFSKHDNGTQALYGIVQGGIYEHLRAQSAEFVSNGNFFGAAIGGTLGCDKPQMYSVLDMAMKHISRSKPIHLLGIGGIIDIFNGVERGIDTFDCVHPTRIGRHGGALVKPDLRTNKNREHINVNNAIYKMNNNPIDDKCKCETCANFTLGYLHHLLKSNEILASTALTLHNVHFMNNLMSAIRESITNGTFHNLKEYWLGRESGITGDIHG